MHMRRLFLLPVAALLLAACSGDGSQTPAASGPGEAQQAAPTAAQQPAVVQPAQDPVPAPAVLVYAMEVSGME
jgi:outer membrane biogenesis lipoprotein LolB